MTEITLTQTPNNEDYSGVVLLKKTIYYLKIGVVTYDYHAFWGVILPHSKYIGSMYIRHASVTHGCIFNIGPTGINYLSEAILIKTSFDQMYTARSTKLQTTS